MGKVCLLTLRNSVIQFYLCLSITWTSSSEVPVCVMNHYGSLYMGTRNETKTGKACQEWTSNSPHQVAGDITDDQFPDNSRAEAKNFCRNPQPTLKPAVWCYTMDPAVEWELCFECREMYNVYGGCKLADKGASYTGRLDRAISHMRCEPWSDHPDPRFVFPDGSAEKAENFCRNPLPSDYNAPWCYVRYFGHPNWEWCDICRPFHGQVTEVSTGNIPKHFLRAEFAGRSCIAFCIIHQTCVVALIERSNHGYLCAYATSVGGETIKVDEGYNVAQYEISRVCVARAKGAAGYFVNIPNVVEAETRYNSDFPWEFMSLEECDKKCLQNTNCVMFNYYAKNSSCCFMKYELDVHAATDGFMERHIVRCNPALPVGPECVMNHYGSLYMGTRNETKTGKACQEWTSNSPHQVAGDITDDQFPDNSRAEAKNFCRNPQLSLKPAVWCYTMDPAVEWELCFECRETYNLYGGCKLADKGASYTGRLDRAISHMRCEPWSDHPDPRFVFPDGSAEKAENFCRNPLPGSYNAPWCYVRNFGHPNWEWCDICRPFQGQVTEVSTGNIPKHFLRAAFAGGSCIAFCILHQTCVVALIERANHGIICSYATSVGGETIKVTEGRNVEQYKIWRVCVARAKGAAGYFVNIPNVLDTASRNNPDFSWEFMSLDKCDKKCLQNTNCAMFNYYTKNSSCCIMKYELDDHGAADGLMERHIVRCNPALATINYKINPGLSTSLQISKTLAVAATYKATNKATNKAAYEAALVATTIATNKAADEAANEAADEANKPTSKGSNESKTSVAVPLLIVFLLLICAGLGFAYYKFVYKKDKPTSSQAGSKEQKQLIAKKETGKDGKQVANAKPKSPPSKTTPLDKNKIKSTPGELPKNRKNATGKPSETVKSAPRSAAKLTKSSIITPKRKS